MKVMGDRSRGRPAGNYSKVSVDFTWIIHTPFPPQNGKLAWGSPGLGPRGVWQGTEGEEEPRLPQASSSRESEWLHDGQKHGEITHLCFHSRAKMSSNDCNWGGNLLPGSSRCRPPCWLGTAGRRGATPPARH